MALPENACRAYHHGNLHQVLLDAAAKLVVERGPESFTLLDAAHACGVSASAPCKHFSDRGGAAGRVGATRRGHAERAAGRAAWDGAAPGPANAFLRNDHACLAFAREERGHYLAPFRSGSLLSATPQAGPSPLSGALAALGIGRGAAGAFALQIRAISHGLAGLERSGQLPLQAETLLDTGVGRLLRGFAAEHGRPALQRGAERRRKLAGPKIHGGPGAGGRGATAGYLAALGWSMTS
jgi:AcrR family transcriptional regulator